ncbi:MAG: hypothetical protein HQL01_13900 [Nitrospirae bacterium]|nr:hypothetical protein [Nitrospirota bacterium]
MTQGTDKALLTTIADKIEQGNIVPAGRFNKRKDSILNGTITEAGWLSLAEPSDDELVEP